MAGAQALQQPLLAFHVDDLYGRTANNQWLPTELDTTNRQRLAVQVRRHNPRYRRGKALLVGYPHNDDTQTSLASDLLGEAWQWQYCDDINEAQETVQRIKPDLVFVNPEQDKRLIGALCKALRAESKKTETASPAPRLYFVASQENSRQAAFFESGDSRPLDQPVIELLINPGAANQG